MNSGASVWESKDLDTCYRWTGISLILLFPHSACRHIPILTLHVACHLTLLSDAKKHGYKAMMLDTFTFLERAIEMYRKRGFYEIGQYTDNPMDDITIYMKNDTNKDD